MVASLAAALVVPTAVAHAELIGRYYWGYFYSTMTGKNTISEVDAVTKKWVRPVAQNSDTIKRGKFVHLNHGSVAEVKQTKHGNKTWYNFK